MKLQRGAASSPAAASDRPPALGRPPQDTATPHTISVTEATSGARHSSLLSLIASQYSFQPSGYIFRRAAFSSMVSGKNSSTGDEKAFGRHGAGRPHIRVAGSLLWLNPIACPISCATTQLGFPGKLSPLPEGEFAAGARQLAEVGRGFPVIAAESRDLRRTCAPAACHRRRRHNAPSRTHHPFTLSKADAAPCCSRVCAYICYECDYVNS